MVHILLCILYFSLKGHGTHISDRGRIYTMQNVSDVPKEVRFNEDFDKHRFFPHGIGVWRNPDTGELSFNH